MVLLSLARSVVIWTEISKLPTNWSNEGIGLQIWLYLHNYYFTVKVTTLCWRRNNNNNNNNKLYYCCCCCCCCQAMPCQSFEQQNKPRPEENWSRKSDYFRELVLAKRVPCFNRRCFTRKSAAKYYNQFSAIMIRCIFNLFCRRPRKFKLSYVNNTQKIFNIFYPALLFKQ